MSIDPIVGRGSNYDHAMYAMPGLWIKSGFTTIKYILHETVYNENTSNIVQRLYETLIKNV